jgi:hypothetical protein
VEHCDECRFTYPTIAAKDLPSRLRTAAAGFVAAFDTVPEPRRRPAPTVWSPLEYACHVRDVLRVQGERLALALQTDNPAFAPMNREERVIRDAYHIQDPPTVLTELTDAAADLGHAFDALTAAQWTRTGVYNWPTVEARTILWLGRHTLHEVRHHTMDLVRATGRSARHAR